MCSEWPRLPVNPRAHIAYVLLDAAASAPMPLIPKCDDAPPLPFPSRASPSPPPRPGLHGLGRALRNHSEQGSRVMSMDDNGQRQPALNPYEHHMYSISLISISSTAARYLVKHPSPPTLSTLTPLSLISSPHHHLLRLSNNQPATRLHHSTSLPPPTHPTTHISHNEHIAR